VRGTRDGDVDPVIGGGTQVSIGPARAAVGHAPATNRMPETRPSAFARTAATRAAGAPAPRPGPLRRVLLGWPVRAVLSLGLIAYLASNLDWHRVTDAIVRADRGLVAAAVALLAVVPLIAAVRWHSASCAANVRLRFRFFLPGTYAAMFAGQFLPSGIGVDAVRLALMWRQRVALGSAIQAIAIDRIAGVSAILVLAYGGMPFVLDLLPPGTAAPIAVMAAIIVTACAALLFVDRLPLPLPLRAGWRGRILALLAQIRAGIGTVHALAALACGLLVHLLSIGSIDLLAHAFGYDLALRQLTTVTAIALFAGMLPISFSGWGVREGAMMVGLALLAVPRDVAVTISFLYGVGSALVSLPGSVAWFHLRRTLDAPGGSAPPDEPAATA
jgi:uncharacterized membrane protein YbhN (UPF0104 family)